MRVPTRSTPPVTQRKGIRRPTLRLAIVAGLLLVGVVAGWSPASAAGSCVVPSGPGGTLSGVVNTYYPGVGTAGPGATSISVGSPSGAAAPIAPGDLLLVIQMQDADIDFTNTTSYGDGVPSSPSNGVTALNSSGRYEYVEALSAVSAGSVAVSGVGAGNGLVYGYRTSAATATAGQRTFQVIRVPQYTSATTSSGLTANAWNGSTGGVLAVDTANTLTLNGTVSVDGLGFRGGAGLQRNGGAGLSNTDVVVSATAGADGNKAEGIAGAPLGTKAGDRYPGGDAARGAPGNAGGGGTDGRPSANDQNSGGGGGANGGDGGVGGNSWSSNLPLGGFGGAAVPANATRLFLGGGGGAGTANNYGPPASAGAAGGGLVLFRAGSVAGTGTISANGTDAYNSTLNDGGGGGGAGGTIVLTASNGTLSGATLRALGGRGGDAWATQAGAGNAHGPGGGGGGGWILTNAAAAVTAVGAGANGITTTGNLTFGSAPGTVGQTATISEASIPGYAGPSQCADLAITKTGPASVSAGGSVTYSLDVTNNGPSTASAVSVVDTLPAGVTYSSVNAPAGWTCSHNGDSDVTCTRPAMAAGASATITVTVTGPNSPTTLTNTATVSSTTADPVSGNNTATFDTTVTGSADLAITKTGPQNAMPGSTGSYTLTVTNNGPSTAADVIVTDVLPAGVALVSASGPGWTCTAFGTQSVTCGRSSLAPGVSRGIDVRVTFPLRAAKLANEAVVSSSTTDPDPTNNSARADTVIGPVADLSLVKQGPATAATGSTISYTLSVKNNGPDAATSVTVIDPLPSGTTFVSASGGGWICSAESHVVTCTRARIGPNATAPSIAVLVTAPDAPGSVQNTASVRSATFDPVRDNDSASTVSDVEATGGGTPLPPTGASLGLVSLTGLLLLVAGLLVTRQAGRRTS